MRPRPHNLFREKKKKKRKWTNENNLEKEREKKGGKERKKKIIIKSCLAKKTNMLLKGDNFQLFFAKNFNDHNQFLKKMCIHLKGECCESFPEHPK